MKSFLPFLLLLLAWASLGRPVAWAQGCTQANTLDYTTAPNGDRKTATETLSGTAFTYSNYNSNNSSIKTFSVGTIANLSGKSLIWQEDYRNNNPATSANAATITLTFTRPVDGLTLTLQDVDSDAATNFTDDVRFDGFPTATGGTAATLTAANFTLGSKNRFVSPNRVQGTAAANPGDATGNVSVTFTTPVQRLVLTYSNQYAYAANVARQQTIGINALKWCALADVTTTLMAPTAALYAGQPTGNYTATFRNNGPDAAANVARTVTLPAGATVTAAQLPAGATTSTTGTGPAAVTTINFGTLATLAANATNSFTFSYTAPTTAGTYAVRSTIATDADQGTNAAPDQATVNALVNPAADVTTTLTAPATLTTGQNSGNYTVTFANNGPSPAQDVTRTVSIPANTAAAVTQTGGTLTGTAATGYTITYPGGTFAAGNSVAYTFSLTPLLTNSLTVTSNTTTTTNQGADTAPNQASTTTPVNAVADVVTTLTTAQTAVAPGASITYSIRVQNNGPLAAANVAPTVQLPAGLLLTAANLPNGATYNNNSGLVTLPTTVALVSGTGSALTYDITFNAPNYSATVTGVAASTSVTPDPAAANNNGSQANAQVSTVVTLPANGCAGPQYGPSRSSGLYAEYFAGYFADNLSFFDGKTAGLTRYDATVNFPTSNSWGNLVPPATGSASDPDSYTARYRGSITIATAGSYTFYLNSDDGSFLWLDGAALAPTTANAAINNGGLHGAAEKEVTLTLSAGVHNLLLVYGENAGGNVLTFSYASTTANLSKRIVPNSVLCASASQPPVAANITNSPAIPNSYGPTTIAALSATDPDGQIDTYTISTLPAAASGTLLLSTNGTLTAVVAGQVILAAQAGDLFFAPAAGATGTPTFTYSATDNSGTASNVATYAVPLAGPATINGRVYEDVNYGGKAGRTYAAASGSYTGNILRPGTQVELYSVTATDATGRATDGAFVTSATTDANGAYAFNLPAAGDYAVRVVSNTVTSVRPLAAGASATGLVPVPTYVYYRDATTAGTALIGDNRRVGGEAPEKQDAAANPGVANVNNRLTLAQLSTASTAAQAVSTLANLGSGTYSNADFGFNFDVITNTNDAGQGSLRQFLLNSNALANTNLAQAGLAAGVETSLFMIPDGTQRPGLRAGLANQLTSNVALITPLSALPAITDGNTNLDGTQQTTNVRNTNTGLLGAGGLVGTNAIVLDQVNRPEVQIVGTPGRAGSNYGLTVAASTTTIQGLAIYGFGNTPANSSGANIYVTTGATTGTLIRNNLIGTSATSFTDPGAAARSTGHGILLQAGTDNTTLFSGTISNNLIGYNSAGGIELTVNAGVNGNGLTTGYVVENNEIRGNAIGNPSSDGIRLGINGGVVRNNLLAENQGPGIDLDGSAGNAFLSNNTVSNNGLSGNGQTPGIRLQGTLNTVSQNIVGNNYGAGIMALATTTRSTLSQNAIFGNGTITTATGGAASGQLGIDLLNPTDDPNKGTSGYASGNANGKTAASGANGLLNFPVIYQAVTNSGNLQLTGYAPTGSTIELFLADRNAPGFGQGQGYLLTVTEGGTVNGITDDNSQTGNYGGTINGLNQGSETGASIFSYTIPLSKFTAAQQVALTASTTRLTATATLNQATSEFSGNVLIKQNSPLPVTLVRFAAQAAGPDVRLTWTTAQELNNDRFVVERSFNGTGFVAVGEVQGQGSSSAASTYHLTDARVAAQAPASLVYYRLRQVDTDGTEHVSGVETVRFPLPARAQVTVHPNPATSSQDAQLDLREAPTGTYQVTLLDLTGRVLRTFTQNGGDVRKLNVTGLPTGTYLVQVHGHGQLFTKRLTKE